MSCKNNENTAIETVENRFYVIFEALANSDSAASIGASLDEVDEIDRIQRIVSELDDERPIFMTSA